MILFEFTVKGPPVSHQTKNKNSLRRWKNDVKLAAQRALGASSRISNDELAITITYYYEGDTPDADNIIKPIQDALIGVCYNDDNQIRDTRSRQRKIDGSYKIRGASSEILQAFSENTVFVHVIICSHEDSEDL